MAEKFVRPLIDYEISLGHKSTLVCNSKKSHDNCHKIPFKINRYNFLFSIFILIYHIYFLKIKNPKFILVHNSSSAIIPLLASKMIGVRNIIYINHGVPFIAYTGITKFILYLLEYLNCYIANYIVTVSEDMKNILQKLTKKKVLIIHHGSASGINLKKFSKNSYDISKIRKRFNLTSNQFVVVYIGRSEGRKGYDFLLSLWENYFIKNNDFKLLVCGVKSTNFDESNILHLGFVENIPEILAISNCLILPSKHEGLPYAILESLAVQCPVIASDIPGVKNLIKNNINGILIKNFDKKEYFEKILYLKENSDFRNSIINKGKICVRKYCRSKFLDAYHNFICNLG